MKLFTTPSILTILSNSDRSLLVQTQGTGDTTIPSNPNLDCGSLDCIFGKQDAVDLTLSWNDNPGVAVGGYVIVIDIEGTNNTFTDSTPGCDILETPSGTYTLQCLGAEIAGSGCSCQMNMNVVSITDGSGNSLNVNTEDCNFSPNDC